MTKIGMAQPSLIGIVPMKQSIEKHEKVKMKYGMMGQAKLKPYM
jgi:hypothetical protein